MSTTWTTDTDHILKAGALAYIDSFTGLVPCKVERIFTDPYYGAAMADVVVTANRPGWTKGERAKEFIITLVTRKTRVKNGHIIVRTFDDFEFTEETAA